LLASIDGSETAYQGRFRCYSSIGWIAASLAVGLCEPPVALASASDFRRSTSRELFQKHFFSAHKVTY
jgi:hypothetical protein